MSISIGALYFYPLKSCRGIQLTEAIVNRMGIQYDRQWTIIDEHGMFVAQRAGSAGIGVEVPSLCLIDTAIDGDTLRLTAPAMPPLTLPLAGRDGRTRAVQVWNSHTIGIDQGDTAADWVSTFISRERPGRYSIVRMPEHERRLPKIGESTLAYADGYPFLMLSSASLSDLNARLEAPLPVNRFRPNIVLDGCAPYEEDAIDTLTIAGIRFEGMTLCLRCAITTTDQLTGERAKEPLRTLATYRRAPGGVVFARNYNHFGEGTLRVGDRASDIGKRP
jgi:uncharacterized protein YcbX